MKTKPPNEPGSRVRIPRPVLRAVLWAAMLVFPALLSFGQSVLPRSLAGFSFGGLFPTGTFNDHVGRDGFGLNLYFGRRAGHSPFFIGLDVLVSYYGHVHRHEYLDNIPEVRVDVNTYNNIGQGLLFVRLQPRSGSVLTYIQGLAGFSYLFTDTTISGHQYGDDLFSSDTNFEDFTMTAGAEAGLGIRLNKRPASRTGGAGPKVFLEFKVRYMAGGNATYLKQGSLIVVGDQASYTADRSATSFLTAQAAFTWFF